MTDNSNAKQKGDQGIQGDQYAFPYHFIPTPGRYPRLGRFWAFSASYMAALELVTADIEKSQSVLHVKKRISYVDIGCGDGALIHSLSRDVRFNNLQMLGVDYDERALAWARMFTPTVDWICSDLSDVADGKFDIASVVEVLEHIDPAILPSFLDGVASVLKDHGKLIVTVPSIGKAVAEKHFQHFSFQTLRDALESNFDIEVMYGFERNDWWYRLIARLLWNSHWRIDVPRVNRYLVDIHKKRHNHAENAGRLFCIANKRSSVKK